jgi:hypothetical protein
MKKHLILAWSLLGLVAVPPAVFAQATLVGPEPPRAKLVLDARGPGAGQGAIALGVTFLGDLPTIDFRYVRGLGEHFDIDASIATLGIAQSLRAGGRLHVFETDNTALAIRASLLETHSFPGGYLAAGIGPGILYSFGSSLRCTVSFDVAWPLLESSSTNSLARAVQALPAVGLEVPIDRDLALVFQASALIALADDQTMKLPILSGGVVW